MLAELMLPGDIGLDREMIAAADAAAVQAYARSRGMVTLRERAAQAIEAGATSAAEARRVLGFE